MGGNTLDNSFSASSNRIRSGAVTAGRGSDTARLRGLAQLAQQEIEDGNEGSRPDHD